MSGAVPADLVAFVDEQYGRVFSTLVVVCGDRAVAEDLAQETFTRTCQHWERVRAMDAPGAWVNRVAVNLALSRWRRRHRDRRLDERLQSRNTVVAQSEGDREPSPDVAAVRGALDALPVDERAVLALRFLADLSVADTASVLGIPAGTVKTRTRRALAGLRASAALSEGEPAGGASIEKEHMDGR